MNLINRIKKFTGFKYNEDTYERPDTEGRRKVIVSFANSQNFDGFEYKRIKFNPNEDSEKLVENIQKYSNLLYDTQISSCVQSRKSGVLSMDWEITSNSDNKTNEVKFIEDVLKDLDLRKIISEILDAVLYGYKPLEVYWYYEGDYIIPKSVIGKPSWWFKFDNSNMPRFMTRNSYDGLIPPGKKIIMVQNNSDYTNPYGESVLAKCYYPAIFKRGGFELWSLFTQKYGMPYIHAKITANKEDLEKAAALMNTLQQDGILVTDDMFDVTTLSAGNENSSENYKSFIDYCNAEISKAILSQTLTTEQGDTGSYAMSKTHFDVREEVIIADSKLVEEAFNTLIKWICDLNFPNIESYPKFIMYKGLGIDKELAERDQIIFSGGYCKPTKAYLTRNHGFKDDEIEMITDKVPPSPSDSFEEKEKDISIIEGETIDIVKEAVKLIEKGTSFEQIKKDIIKLFPKINNNDLEEVISKGVILATANGLIKGN